VANRVISFARGAPAPECLPAAELADCARAALERDGATALGYGPATGYPPLRNWLAQRHGVAPERILVTNSSLQAFAFLVQHLAAGSRPRVLVEAPTYDRPLKILAAHGADVVALPMDEDGLDPDALERELDAGDASLLYTIPTFQNPSGRTLSLERRRRVAAIAAERGLLVLEDDPYGLVRFEGDALPPLFELEGGERVVYGSSFSKTIAPGLRVGWLVAPEPLAAALAELAVSTYISPVVPTQATVYEFLRRGHFESNLERVRGLLRARRDAMLGALERELPAGATWSEPNGGYFVWVDLAAGIDTRELLTRASAAGVTFVAGTDFFPSGAGGESALRLAYSFVSPEEIAEGIGRFGSLLPEPARRGR
jgi:DNA-binding transcriptional MocR family regulator